MIAITLNFKSIEAARQALLDIPSTALVGGPAAEPTPETEVAAPKATAAPKAASGASEGNGAAGSFAQEAPAASTASSSEPVEYPVLQKAVFALAGKSREAAAGVAGSFGVKTFKELPQDKWADALAAVNAKLAELEAA